MTKLYGLVLAGGKSSRMKTDKAALNYHGVTQLKHTHDLLCKFCSSVFVSVREEQQNEKAYQNLALIFDTEPFFNIGPLGGILSAMHKYPHVSWLVLACDLPFVTKEAISYLMTHRDLTKIATAYISAHDRLPEPLCAIYEKEGQEILLRFLKKNIHCPRKILSQSNAHLLELQNQAALDNINDPQEYDQAKKKICNHKAKIS